MSTEDGDEVYGLVAAGELLVDLISQESAGNLGQARTFERFQGGSPSNLAANMARLGQRVAVVSCVGNDSLGTYLREQVAATGADTRYIAIDSVAPTSLVVVSRSEGTPDFVAYRGADAQLQPHHLPQELLRRCAVLHTTCFALSREPARSSLLDAARGTVEAGGQVSLDVNYAPRIWPDRHEALEVVSAWCSRRALVKASGDDVERLFGTGALTPERALDAFHEMGASLVCLTLGKEGSLISTRCGETPIRLPSRPVQVVDATGAGDAYWAGFLTAWLRGHPPELCGKAGGNLAALKLERLGPLPASLPESVLFG
ncbi:carbohydrate kinase [Archangium violaceum]|uniref:carbohydrate kinase family protein n=1 Tax=Archangium violaceum TaxID=83451 RepID=UPI00194E9916|nr:carbohydrate kinase [Archangium violaceum]QRN99836.1 carbohydrate kinase [Archangium violaceum]